MFTCRECRCWKINEDNHKIGDCRAAPPVVLFDTAHNDLISAWPVTSESDGCDAGIPVNAGTDYRSVIESLLTQYAYAGQHNGRLHLSTGGVSALEEAFDALGWEEPHPVPDMECQREGCHARVTCGVRTTDGYEMVCHAHGTKGAQQ